MFRLLRPIPALLVLVGAQWGLYLTLRGIYAPRAVGRRKRALAAIAAVAGLVPVYFLGARLGMELPPPLRWLLVEPLLAAQLLAAPLFLVLGIAYSVARRLPRPSRAPEIDASATVASASIAPPPAPAAALAADGLPPLPEGRRVFLARAAGGLVAASGAGALAGIAAAELPPVVSRYDVPLAGLHPDLDGLTILHLSDIHAGALMTEARMEAIARRAAALSPDVVALTGDLLDVSRHAAEPFARAFSALHGKLGTFAVLGNHDYYAGPGAAVKAVQGAGGTLLRNTGVRVGRGRGSLWIGGVDDPLASDYRGGAVDADRALRGAAPGEPRVVLAHRPSLFDACARAGAGLVLSGHTHGGQFALDQKWSLARVITPYTMGWFRERRFAGHAPPGAARLFVHRGLGVVGAVPMRLGSRPEIVLLTLRRV